MWLKTRLFKYIFSVREEVEDGNDGAGNNLRENIPYSHDVDKKVHQSRIQKQTDKNNKCVFYELQVDASHFSVSEGPGFLEDKTYK